MSAASGSLPRYILVRLLLVIPMMWVLLTVVFFLLRVAPGDPVTAAVGGKLDEAALDQRRAALGLDRPLIVQYLEYLGNVARLDFGKTISDNRPVIDIIRDQGGATLTLTLGAFLIALLIGLPLGRLAGRYRDTAADAGIRVFGVVTYAAPIFWTGIMLVLLVVAVLPGWPTNDIASVVTKFEVQPKTHILLVDAVLAGNGDAFVDVLKHHVLPCLALGLLLAGVIIRLVRVNVIQALKGDYVEAARARGIPERRVVRHHAFRNALVPGDHRDRPPGRDHPVRRPGHRDARSTGRGSAPSWSSTSSPATTSRCRAWSRSSPSSWSWSACSSTSSTPWSTRE